MILALPATSCGILTMPFVISITLNVPSLMRDMTAVGVRLDDGWHSPRRFQCRHPARRHSAVAHLRADHEAVALGTSAMVSMSFITSVHDALLQAGRR